MLQETVARSGRFPAFKLNATLGLLAAFVLMCIIFGLLAPTFLSGDNVVTIASTLAGVGISAIGMTMGLISGGVDLSVGSVAALTGVAASLLCPTALPSWPATAGGL